MRSIKEGEIGLKGQITIDIGCGPVNNLFCYGFKGEPQIAVDINKSFLERRKTSKQGENLVQADAARLPIKSGVADHVFAAHVLEHVDGFPETLDEIGRILALGGKVTIAVPHPRFENVIGQIDKGYHNSEMHQRVISPDELRSELEGRSFTIVENKTRGLVPAVYKTFFYLVHRRILKDRKDGLDKTSKMKQMVKKFIYSRLFSVLFTWLDKVYPFENHVVAIKSGKSGEKASC